MPKIVVSKTVKSKIFDMLKKDIPVTEISKKLGVSTALIYYHIKKSPENEAVRVVLRKSNEALQAENKQLKIVCNKLNKKFYELVKEIDRVLDKFDE